MIHALAKIRQSPLPLRKMNFDGTKLPLVVRSTKDHYRRYESQDLLPTPPEQSSAERATLRFTLGAGVTPAARRAGDYSFDRV
jgi:hypothetical protein